LRGFLGIVGKGVGGLEALKVKELLGIVLGASGVVLGASFSFRSIEFRGLEMKESSGVVLRAGFR
jgi:hypothetical protein